MSILLHIRNQATKMHRVPANFSFYLSHSTSSNDTKPKKDSIFKKTPKGKFDEEFDDAPKSYNEKEPLEPHPNGVNPTTGEVGGPKGPEPTRYGDWERKGRCIDF